MNKRPDKDYYLGIFEMTEPQMKAIIGKGNYSNDNKNIQYQGFYCKIIDILIEYNGMIDTKLYSVDFKLYNIEK